MTTVNKLPTKAASTPSKKLPDMADLYKSLAYSLRRAQLSTYGDFLLALEGLDIRPAQYTTLVVIRANPGLTQSAISNAIGIQKANFVALLDRLEERGLTERRKVGGDRRSSALYLTAKGKTFVTEMEAAHARMEAGLFTRLGEVRSKELLSLLHDFAALAPDANPLVQVEAGASPKKKDLRSRTAIAASAGKPAKRKQSARPAPRLPARKPSRG